MEPSKRPAELAAFLAAAIAVAVAFGWKLSEEQVAALLAFVGLLPGMVTAAVEWRRSH